MEREAGEHRTRRHPLGGIWVEFRPPGARRWITVLGSPFRTEDDAQAAVADHLTRLNERGGADA
jgi:hypothetical protein